MITVEVVYALPDEQHCVKLQVEESCTAARAFYLSGFQQRFAELGSADLGIYSRPLDGRTNPAPDQYVMRDGDRLEKYRPLQIDPKKARLQRAARSRQRK
jgi:putative ubiquitin-RnfH superfamily antitoxin RatB of RatAB toxin-antitoxin module